MLSNFKFWLLGLAGGLIPLGLVAAISACTAPMVATAGFDGRGQVWTDGVLLVAIGEFKGDINLRGSGIVVSFPTKVDEGQILLIDRMAGTETRLDIDYPIPPQFARLFQPGEAEAAGITWELPELQ
jgi:hypothetical protein